MKDSKEISLKYLFFTFLKIGAISWGGYMALIAMMKKQLVDKDKVIREEIVLDGISLASILPGAISINVATYIGFQLRGIRGAIFCLTATILPAFLLILCFGIVYSNYGDLPVFNKFFKGILPAISAIILSVAIGMAKKQIHDYKQLTMCILAGIFLLSIHSFYATQLVIISSAVAGYFLYKTYGSAVGNDGTPFISFNYRKLIRISVIFILLVSIIALAIWICGVDQLGWYKINKTIFLTFSGMSLSLFGGGYVIVPAMQTVIVEGFHWLTTKEFSDAIAMGQITPGPVIITATFIGFRVAGYLGALVATLAIFFPPGFVMIIFSGFLDRIKNYHVITAIFKGMRPAIIGMIFTAAFTIAKGAEMVWLSALIFLTVLILLMKFRLNVIWMIPLSGIAGILLF
jgi:chromate transporter